MTEEEFLEKLAKLRLDWHLEGPSKAIRCGDELTCPINAVAGVPGQKLPHWNGLAIGLPVVLSVKIINSADNIPVDCELRPKLLKACGLA